MKTVPEKRPFYFYHFCYGLQTHFDFDASDSQVRLFPRLKKHRGDGYRQLILLEVNQAHI